MLRDRIVVGIADGSVRTQMVKQSDLTFSKAFEICRVAEVTGVQSRVMQSDGPVQHKGTVDAVERKRERNLAEKLTNEKRNQTYNSRFVRETTLQFGNSNKKSCSYCSYTHVKARCPAYGEKCLSCGRSNHFAAMCPTANQVSGIVPCETGDDVDGDDEALFTDAVRRYNSDSRISYW